MCSTYHRRHLDYKHATDDHGVRAVMPFDLLPDGRNPIVISTAADSTRFPHARFLPVLISQQQNARGYYAAWVCPTKQPSRFGVHGWRPRVLSRNVQTCSPSFPITPTSAFCSTFSSCYYCCRCCCRGVHTATSWNLKSPLHYARRGCPRLYSRRGASTVAVLPSFRRDTTFHSCSYAFTIGKFRRCGTAALPATPSAGGD